MEQAHSRKSERLIYHRENDILAERLLSIVQVLASQRHEAIIIDKGMFSTSDINAFSYFCRCLIHAHLDGTFYCLVCFMSNLEVVSYTKSLQMSLQKDFENTPTHCFQKIASKRSLRRRMSVARNNLETGSALFTIN